MTLTAPKIDACVQETTFNLDKAIPNDIKTKNIVAYVSKKVVFSKYPGTSHSKYKNITETIIAYIGIFLINISKEKLFFANKTPSVKWRRIITEAIADATPNPAVPYANKQIGIPMFPVLGKINGGSSLIKSFFNNNKNKTPAIENRQL